MQCYDLTTSKPVGKAVDVGTGPVHFRPASLWGPDWIVGTRGIWEMHDPLQGGPRPPAEPLVARPTFARPATRILPLLPSGINATETRTLVVFPDRVRLYLGAEAGPNLPDADIRFVAAVPVPNKSGLLLTSEGKSVHSGTRRPGPSGAD